MARPLALVLHAPAATDAPPLTALLAAGRGLLAARHAGLLADAGARVRIGAPVAGRPLGALLAELLAEEAPDAGLVLLPAGAVPLLRPADAALLVTAAASGAPVVRTNNRWSSDVLALGDRRLLGAIGEVRVDNALPRLLAAAGAQVTELPGRARLALDLDTPLDLALLATVRGCPPELRALAAGAGVAVPRRAALRAIARDPAAELLVAGRTGSATLRHLERGTACRVRFLAEERGLRAAAGARGTGGGAPRPPRSTLGRLLAVHGPDAFGAILAELADGAIVDTRVLLADRLGADEAAWPTAEDRFAADLLRPDAVADPWLRALTAAAASAPIPVQPGSHTLVGPGIRPLLA
ncbi:MAG: hypothetical protein ACKOTZ_00955 [Chloroflexota bacterium]